MEAQELFYKKCAQIGQDILDTLDENEKAMIIIGRPYNSADQVQFKYSQKINGSRCQIAPD